MSLDAIPLPRKVKYVDCCQDASSGAFFSPNIRMISDIVFLSYLDSVHSLSALDDFEYRKVKVTGKFRHDQEILLGPRTRGDGQPGYFLITPFERSNGYDLNHLLRIVCSRTMDASFGRLIDVPKYCIWTRSKILVRRGWVPRDKKDQSTRLDGLPEGELTVEGLLRSGEQKASSFVPENSPEKNEWYSLDLEAMAKQSDSQPVVVEMILGMFHEPLLSALSYLVYIYKG